MEINLGGEQSRPEPWPPAIADNNLPFYQTTFDLRGGGQVSLGEGREEQRINLEAPEEARARPPAMADNLYAYFSDRLRSEGERAGSLGCG